MKMTIAGAATMAFLVAVGGAQAANRAGTFSLTPFVGGYTFDGKQHLETAPVVGARGGYSFTDHVGAEAAFDYVPTKGTKGGGDADVYNYNLDLLYNFFPESRLVPFLMAGYGGNTVDPDQGQRVTKGTFNYGAGLKYALTDAMELRGEVRHLIFSSTDTMNNIEYGLGLGFLFGAEKPAPAPVAAPEPAPKSAPEPVAVVPPPVKPSCNLTVTPARVTQGEAATLDWACQNATSADLQPGIGPVAPSGSRKVAPAATTSYTLVGNGAGGSATSTALLTVQPVPAPTGMLTATPEAISQGDGTTLAWDCTNATSAEIQPEIGPVPVQGSRAITPAADTAYTLVCKGAGGSVDKMAKVTVIPPEKLTMKLEVEFDTGKANIKEKYHDEIGRVAAFLKEYPSVKGTIEGHTDNVGSAEMNMKLSQRRADSIRKYLIDRYGIDPARLSAVGYGMTRPIADNKTAAGRQKNRRIQAHFETVVKKK